MPFKKLIPNDINRKFSIRFSTPTQDIATTSVFQKYFSPDCAYNIIPGFENTSLIDVESFLLQILPLTSNSILDITLPFIQVTKKKTVVKHLGRYIIVDKVLYGIRIKISDNWPKSRNIKIPISANLQHFYDQNYITSYPSQITVGQFILATQHFKLAPLFSSQLSSLLDNNTYNLLNDYYYLGCEIFSIVNDLTEDKRKTLKDPFEIFKNYRRDTTIFVYSGMHINVDSTEIYKTKSYAIQTADRLKKIHVSTLDEVYNQTFIVDLNLTKKNKRITEFDSSKILNSDIQIIECNSRIKHCFDKIDFHAIGRFEEPMEIQEEQNQIKIKANEFLMYLWNIFVKFNNRNPFILPLPMNKKEEILINKIFQLQEVTKLKKSELVNFIKLDPKVKLPKKYEIFDFKPFTLERIPASNAQLFPIYFPLKERILSNGIDKDERFLEEVEKRVVNCLGCISDEMFKSLENESAAQKIQVLDQDQKFIEKFLKKKNPSLEMFYFEMAKYYPRDKLTQEFIQSMYQSLKLITKRQINGSPFQAFILKKSYEQVHYIFIEAERKFFLNSIKNEEQPEADPSQTAENTFRVHIKKVAYHVFSQKKSHIPCHMCSGLFNKKISNTYGRMCLGCSNYVCYACFDKKTGAVAQNQQVFQQCLICQNKCDCEQCIKKRLKNNDVTSRMSFFKSSNNLVSSNENIRIEQQPSFLNENNRTNDNILKTENIDKNKSVSFKNNSMVQEQQITIQRCWTCELHNRIERIIRFECSTCKSEKCLDCEKSQNPKRSWVLRGKRLCNKCFYEQNQLIFKQAENKNLKSKVMALQHEIVLLKRNNFLLNLSASAQLSNPFGDHAIVEEINDNQSESNHSSKIERGGFTPIFERSSTENRGGQSPISLGGKENSAELGSNASFGGQNMQMNKEPKKRRNSSKSSGSGSNKSKKQFSAKKNSESKQTTSKRKKSSGSEESGHSFQKKRSRSNSSKGSEKKKPKLQRNSSAESGEYQESSSENHNTKQQPKKDWKKNHHQNTDQPNYNDNRGGFRQRGDRGGSRGGNRQFDNNRQGGEFKKWDNNRDFRGRNDDRRGSSNRFNNDDRQGGYNNRFNNKNDDRQGSYTNRFNNNDRQGGYNNRNNNSFQENNNSYRDNRNDYKNDSRSDINNNKQGLLFTSSNASISNNEDLDY